MIVNLPKLGAVEFPDNLTSEQYDSLVGRLAEKYDFSMPKPPASLGTIAKRGFMRSAGELGIAATDIIPAMISTGLGGDKEYAERQMQEAAQARQELEQKYPTRFRSYKDISSPFEALEYGAETIGELAPSALASIVPGGAGSRVLGTAARRAALAEATAAGAPTRAALAGVEQAAEAGARKGMYGGVFLGSYAQNAPEIFEGIYRETGNFESGIAALTGGLSASLDSVLPAKVLNTLGKYGKLKVVEEMAKRSGAAPVAWKTIGREAAETAASEGLTESVQEAIGVYAQKLAGSAKDLLSPENIEQYKEAFIKGAVGGGLFGLPGGVVQARRERADFRNTQEAQKALAEQEAAQQGITTPLQERIDALVSGRMDTPITEEELSTAFKYTKDELAELQARMDAARPGSEAYAELDAAIKQKQEALTALDTKKAQTSAFATAVPDEQGLFQAQQRIDVETLKSVGINPKSKAAQTLIGADLTTPEGVSTFIKTIEAPGFMGKVDEKAYDQLVGQLNPEYVTAARTELKGAPSVAKPIEQPSGAGVGVAGKSDTGAAPAGVGAPKSDGVVRPATDVGQATTGTEGKPRSVDKASVDAAWGMLQRAEKAQREADMVDQFSKQDNLFEVAVSLYQQGFTDPKELAAELGIGYNRAAKLLEMTKQFDLEVEPQDVSRGTTEGETIEDTEIPENAYVDNESDNAKVASLDTPNLPPMNKDARAYFGRADTETALRNIANDLVFQPTAYRNSKMKAFEKSPQGPEPAFRTEREAAMFVGQGGVHAKNAEKWARENLTPENVAYLDKWIAQYKKEDERSKQYRSKLEKRQKAKAALKQDIEAAPVELTTAQELENYGIKQEARTRSEAKKMARKAISEMQTVDEDFAPILDSDLNALLASPEIAALSTSLHPAVEAALKQGNLVRALGLFADSINNARLTRIAETLASVLGNVKVVYGAEKSMYDPKTNTIYLPNNATDYDLIHEASHAGLSHIIANPSHPITRQLNKVFEQVKSDIDGAYGARNLQEFVAEVWSNDDFRTQLKEKRSEVPTLSLWDKIIRTIRRFFRMPDRMEPTLDQVDRLLDAIVGPPPDSRSGDTLYAQAIHGRNIPQKIFEGLDKVLQSGTKMTPQQAARFIGAMENTGMSLRRGLQKFLNLSAVGQVGAEVFRRGVFNRELARLLKEGVVEADARKQAKAIADQAAKNPIDFADTVNEMAGYRENLIEKLMPLDKRLQEFSTKPEFAKWTKMVHEHTREDIDPEAPASKYANSEKAKLHAQFQKEFNSLTPEGKKLYHDLFGAYKKLFEELQSSLYANLVDVHKEGTPEHKAALGAYEKVIGMIIAKGIDHYAPLYRQGSFWLEYKNKDGELVRELYNSQVERQLARKAKEAEGNSDFDEYVKVEGAIARRAPTGTIAAQIIKIMKEGGADDSAVEKFLELIISAMPETSVLKSFNARKGTLGYEENAATAFRNVTNNLVGQLARMRYSDKLQRLLDGMAQKANQLRGEDNIRAKEVVQELDARYSFAMKPTIEAWARWASGGAFYFNLAGNVSSALVNVLQTPMVVFPQLGGTYGFTDAGKALMAATKLYSSSQLKRVVTDINGEKTEQNAMLSIENLVNSGKAPQYAPLVQRLKDLGFLQTSTARDALEASNMSGADPTKFKTMAERTALYSSFLFHHAERMNREVTAIAAFDLEMNRLKGKGITGEAAQAQAIDKAIRMVEFTHGAGHAESAPSIGHSSLGKVLTVFKRFAFTMYYMLFDTIRRSLPVPPDATPEQRELAMAARRQLLGIYGMSGLFAGVKGMPLYWVAQMAYDAFADDDEDKFDEVMRKYLGEFLFKGPVNYVTNLGIADRVGWTDLIYRDQKGDKADASVLSQFLENILGAPYAVVNNVFRGQELIGEGQFYRGVETMLPVSLKNPMKAFRYATEDARTLRGDMVGEVNGYNAAMQVLGFAPADLLTKYEENSYIKSKEDATVGQAKKLLKQYYIALNMGDQDRMDALEDKLFALGDRHPDLKISQDTINKSVKARDAITRDMYQGIEINKKMRNELIDSAEEIFK
jgi:hypothetical protein